MVKNIVVKSLYSGYNRSMRMERLHSWQVNGSETLDMPWHLAAQVSKDSKTTTPRFIAGVDTSTPKAQGMTTGAMVVLSYPELRVVETKVAQGELTFPYIPGLLSFRESPLVLAVCERLIITPDLNMVDGQGITHSRRMGLTSHLGLFLNTPTTGCAKPRLYGSHEVPGSPI